MSMQLITRLPLLLAVSTLLMLGRGVLLGPVLVRAESSSAPAILQMFEARWDTVEDRMADIFQTGYGQMWIPPTGRADSSNFSAGYDSFDRFDLGSPRNETLYGTETSLKAMIHAARNATVDVYADLILNHNGFSDLGTFDNQGTPGDTSDDVTFAESGGYPGFVITLPDDIDGDFHSSFEGGDLNGRLSGLIDIDQSKNHQFIRHPIDSANPNNIPAGTSGIFGRPPANVPNPNNARFYPDQGLGGRQFDVDPGPGEFLITRYDFNIVTPLAGDPVLENAEALTLRHAQWMVQEIGVDGFRIDAAKHFPQNTLTKFDQTVYAANPRLNHDGSIKPVFSFSEVLDGNAGFVQSFANKGLPNPSAISPSDNTVRGNRDVLDFPLSFALRSNLTDNGFANNWHGIRGASMDNHDDGFINGSTGVLFVNNHDDQNGDCADFCDGDGTPFLDKVAYAYTLMRPGNAVVYFNGEEFGTSEFRGFPTAGTDDALGGPVSGDAVSTLVKLRNSHGRGDFHERWLDDAFNPEGFSNVYIYERNNSALVGLNSRVDSVVETRTGVQTGFAPGTILVELTGNATDAVVDPSDTIPGAVKVNGSGQVDVSIPGSGGHGRGYVVYGLATPQGTMSLTNVANTLGGPTPTATNNGTTRQSDIDVIHADSFNVQLTTSPVSVPDPDNPGSTVRDFAADGDQSLLKIDGGRDVNSTSGIDYTTPGAIDYGFEEFTTTRIPGYIDNGSGTNIGSGTGTYVQTIDATQLAEGRHYLTARTFRHRDSGPAVFEDVKKTIYIDRLPPEAALVSFEPFASDPEELQDRDLVFQSTDQTADNMHIFLDLPANLSDAQVLAMALGGQGDAGEYDRDQWISGFFDVTTGNHVATVVTFEQTFNQSAGVGFNVQRFSGLFTDTGVGAGFGDLDSDDTLEITDLAGLTNGSFEEVLFSQNAQFNAAADVDGDGDVDNLDLIALGDELSGASTAVIDAYDALRRRRGDVNGDGKTDGNDVFHLHANFGGSTWLEDLNVDGTIDIADVETLITDLVDTSFADFDLDGDVDGNDFFAWQRNLGTSPSARFDQGDANLNGFVGSNDLMSWKSLFGNSGTLAAGSAAVAVPEPTTACLLMAMLIGLSLSRSRCHAPPAMPHLPCPTCHAPLAMPHLPCPTCHDRSLIYH